MHLRRVILTHPLRAVAMIALAACVASMSACLGDNDTPTMKVQGGDVTRGARAIDKYGCGSCHVIPGIRDARGMVGPPLTAFGRRTIIAGRVLNDADSLEHWIRAPQEIEPGTAMPNLNVTEQDARDIAAYLLSLH